jgi:hypothetical protein
MGISQQHGGDTDELFGDKHFWFCLGLKLLPFVLDQKAKLPKVELANEFVPDQKKCSYGYPKNIYFILIF